MSQSNKSKATLKETSDEQIIRLLNNADSYEQGFRYLMSKYQERLYWHIRRLVIEHEDANDVIQNTFIKVYKGFKNFKGDSKLYTWLYRIATNESITFINKRKRHSTDSLDHEDNNLENQLEADAYFDGDAVQLHLQKALASLPEKQKIVFNLRYFEEMPYKKMAAILETSEGALKASYHHAVKKIEQYFKAISQS